MDKHCLVSVEEGEMEGLLHRSEPLLRELFDQLRPILKVLLADSGRNRE